MYVHFDERREVGEKGVREAFLLFMETQHHFLQKVNPTIRRCQKQHMILWRQKQTGESNLCLCQVLLTVRLVVFLLHEGNPAQLAFLDEGLDVHSTKSISADPFIVLQHKPIV